VVFSAKKNHQIPKEGAGGGGGVSQAVHEGLSKRFCRKRSTAEKIQKLEKQTGTLPKNPDKKRSKPEGNHPTTPFKKKRKFIG